MKQIFFLILFMVCLSCVLFCHTERQKSETLDWAEARVETKPSMVLHRLQYSFNPEWNEANRARYAVLFTSAYVNAGESIPSDSLMLEAVAYYEQKGTANQKTNAYYLLGCCYRDQQWYDEAGKWFYRAVGSADTTAADCDFRLLARVYSQLAGASQLDISSKKNLARIERYAQLGRDTLTAIHARMALAKNYWQQHKLDTAIVLYLDCYADYRQQKSKFYALQTAKQLGGVYTEKGSFEEADMWLKYFEQNEVKWPNRLKSPERDWDYWLIKASNHIGRGEPAAAIPILFRAYRFDHEECRLAATKQLSELYRSLGRTDSAYLFLTEYTKLSAEKIRAALEDRQAKIRTHFTMEQERTKRQESERRTQLLWGWIGVLSALGMLAAWGGVYLHRARMQRKNRLIEEKVSELYSLTETLRYSEEKLSLAERQVLDVFRSRFEHINSLCNQYFEKRDSAVLHTIGKDIEWEIQRMGSKEELATIEAVLNEHRDNLIVRMREEMPQFSDDDIKLLTLVYAGLSPKGICLIMGLKLKAYYNKKARLKERIVKHAPLHAQNFLEYL